MFKGKFDVAVLGGGPGGYVAAIRASQLGGNVALIECDKLGGTCVNRGCIPTKALLESVKVYNLLRNAGDFGINVNDFSIDVKAVMGRAERISNEIAEKISVLMEKKGVNVIHGFGRIKDVGVIDVLGKGRVNAEKLILAPGSLPMKPPIPGIEGRGVITSDEALRLEDLPERLAIIGGGVVGLEFSSIFAGMGVDVTVIEMMPHVLPGEDAEMSDYLSQLMREKGIKIHTNTKVSKIEDSNGGKLVSASNGKKFPADLVLLAVGRKPRIENLGLENIGVKTEGGKILVNERMETNVPGVYAVGDVIGGFMLAHVAMHEGIVAAENAMGLESKVDYRAVPRCVYTQPEAAFVGLTEEEAKKESGNVETALFPFSANGRAATLGEAKGVAKLVFDGELNEILGAQVVGPEASELIHEVVLAMKVEATVEDLADMIHAHPTLSETIKEAALKAKKMPIHL